jgi:hypothetical protein
MGTDFSRIINEHLTRYPVMQLEDLYKLAHQACLGSEHAVASWDYAQQRLQQELVQMGDGPAEPLVDPITADGRIVRVHLRPLVAGGGDVDQLLDAFIRTAAEYAGTPADLENYATEVEAIAATGAFPFQPADVGIYWQRLEVLGYPAVHHSAVYRTAYQPAYRVIAAEFLPLSVACR